MKKQAFISSPEKVFLFLGILYGILFLLITPPFQVPDEPNHFYRAYQMSEGRLIAVKQNGIGGLLPKSLSATTEVFNRLAYHPENKQNVKDIFSLLTPSLDRKDEIFTHFPNTALYSPIPYLPQAFGIALGKIPHSSPLVLMYLGRIINLSVWIFLVYLAIKVTPICKWLFFLLALMPMSLFQAASLSPDSFTNGISFLLISVFLGTAYDNTEGPKINSVAIFAVSLLLSLSKQAYFLMPLLFLLISVEKVGTKRKFYTIFFLLFLLDVGAILFWTLVADIYKDIYILYNSVIPTLSAEKQTLYILSHPLEYCGTVAMTFIQNGILYMDSLVGQLGWFDTGLPEPFRISYIVMLFFAVLSESREDIIISLKQRSIICVTLLLSILLVSTLAFIGWAPVGSKTINIQGRYFIPLSPLFFLLFYNRKISRNLHSSGAHLAIACYALFSLTYTAYVIIKRYYIV